MLSEWLILQGIIERGLIFAVPVMAIYLTSRIIQFDDLSVKGVLVLAVTSSIIINTQCALAHCPALVIVAGASQALQQGYCIPN